jgi:hypothetical protein
VVSNFKGEFEKLFGDMSAALRSMMSPASDVVTLRLAKSNLVSITIHDKRMTRDTKLSTDSDYN